MEREIAWLVDWDVALTRAKEKDLPVFLDFFNPN
jgi:hypothetical protein